MPVTTKVVDEVIWNAGEIELTDSFFGLFVSEREDEHERELHTLGHNYEDIDDVADEALRVARNDVSFDPTWVRIIRSDGMVSFGTDEYEPDD